MSTISPSLQIGGVNGWKGKEGAVLGWQQTSGNLFKPAKFDFTRLSGSASYVDENGLIQIEHRPNYPRFTWKDGKQCLMNEEARTNICLQSEDFSTTWATSNTSVSTNATTAPDGNTTADQLSKSAASGYITQTVTFAGQTFFSIYAKAGSLNWIRLGRDAAEATYFDLSNGVVGTVGADSASITALEDGWYRCTIEFSFTGSQNVRVYPADADNDVSGTSGNINIWGAQIETNVSYASSYIPTEGSAVTRAAESIEGLNLGNFLGDSQGGLYLDGLSFSSSSVGTIALSDGTSNNRITMVLPRGAGTIGLDVAIGGVVQTGITGSSLGANTFYKSFIGYASSDYALYLNGSQEGTTTNATFSANTLDRLALDNGGSGQDFRGLIHELRAYDQRPANSQMETETT